MKYRRWFRFSLATLLFLTSCFAGFFAGYQHGFKVGGDKWIAWNYTRQTFQVDDLLPPPHDAMFAAEQKALTDYLESSFVVQLIPIYVLRTASRDITVLCTPAQIPEIETILNRLRSSKQTAMTEGEPFHIPQLRIQGGRILSAADMQRP